MAEKRATVRVAKNAYRGPVGMSYGVIIEGRTIFFPSSITEVSEPSGEFVDLDCPLWFAKKNDLGDLIVAEY